MKLIFELGVEGRGMTLMPECDVPEYQLPEERSEALHLPHVSENELTRHYTALCKRIHGVNDGFYPLGSCTMKYNPKIDEDMAALPGFTQLHPLQPIETAQGALEALHTLGSELGEVFGMDAVTFQPAAGAHGEFTGVLLIKAYHTDRGDFNRTKIIVPDSAHGTNPATAAMCGFQVVNIPSGEDGCVDLDALRAAVAVGDTVHKGDTLCIIEAMKLMNEINSEMDGEIAEICVGNGQVVEYDQPLFRII